MSRIGTQPIKLPTSAQVNITESNFQVTGPKGTLNVDILPGIKVTNQEGVLTITRDNDEVSNLHGLIRTLISNAIVGVTEGWKKDLEINGVGYRAQLAGSNLNMSLGFSHPVVINAPEGISFTVVKNVITVSGIDKQLVGETAANIRKLRKPEPYKGKGIKYSGEYIRRKAGKTGKAK